MSADVRLPRTLDRLRLPSLAGGAGLLVLGLVLAFVFGQGFTGFMQAYLFAFLLVSGLAIGSVAMLCIHHMTRGAWSYVIQRILEACSRTLWVIAVLFIPILLGVIVEGVHGLYAAWLDPEGALFEEVIENKDAILNPAVWSLTSVGIFLIWLSMAYLLNTWSRRLDETGDATIIVNFRRFSPPALIVYCLTMTYAGLNWYMSVSPEWFSTMYGPLTWIGQGLTLLAFSILILSYIQDEKPLSRVVQAEHYHHLGNLMLAFTVLWAYMSFSQYLIIWAGNLPEEISYYINRNTFGYNVLAVILMAGHFFFPLMWLLFRRNKLNLRPLRMICAWILIMRLFDAFWVTYPSFPHDEPGIYVAEVLVALAAVAGLFGVWFWFFLGELTKRPLLALNDPALYEAVTYRQHGEAPEHA